MKGVIPIKKKIVLGDFNGRPAFYYPHQFTVTVLNHQNQVVFTLLR